MTVLLLALGAGVSAGFTSGVPAVSAPHTQEPPALTVILVIDQLSADLLERYDDLYEGGLARLTAQGRRFVDGTHDHGITETSPGHATISTGTHPAQHGMVSNIWYTWEQGGGWMATENVIDPTVAMVGGEQYAGSSPAALMRSGIGDWMVAQDPASRVVSVSGKDRAAILLAGQGRHFVYWFEPELGRFATSTYYREVDAEWIPEFNEDLGARIAMERAWESSIPSDLVPRARPDSAMYEADGIDITFPHAFTADPDSLPADFHYWWSETPFLDRETLALARAAVEAMGLGDGSAPDLLAISLSATDRVGHAFGPGSQEQLDNMLRLDRELGGFFDYLDDRFADRYVLAFTADHGVSEAPEALLERGVEARRLTREDGAAFNERAGAVLAREAGDAEKRSRALAELARDTEWIGGAWPAADLEAEAEGDSIAGLLLRSLYPGRTTGLLGRLGVEMVLTPHTLLWAFPRGTTHGSPYLYDRRVPLIFLGRGVEAGSIDGRASTTSIAATLARELGVSVPDGVVGAPLPLR